MSVVADLTARLRADTRGFTAQMAAASAQVKGLESSTTSMGNASKMAWGAAGAAVAIFAGAAVKASMAFETTMTRTVTLAGSTEDEMKRLSGEILNVAASLGKSPQELADALYYTESAGISTAHAMDVVTVSAKASAIGLGETQTVADALTSVLNAYGEQNISAAKAADILTAAVRDGKGEADAIAGAIGRIIPIASEMGVSFDQVAAGIAALTQTGLDANEAVTSLRGILTSLLNPSTQASDALASIGMSAESVQASIKQNGLLATLQQMQEGFKGNTSQMGAVFGNVRALAGAMSLLGNNSAEVQKVFEDVANSGGTVEEAFARVQQTAEFKLQAAIASVKVALVQVGGALAPVVKGFFDLLAAIAPLLKVIVPVVAALVGFHYLAQIPVWAGMASKAIIAFGGTVLATARQVAVGLTMVATNFTLALSSMSPMLLIIAGIATAAALLTGNFKLLIPVIAGVAVEIGSVSGALTAAQASMGAFAIAAYAVVKAFQAVSDYRAQDDKEAVKWVADVEAGTSSMADYRTAIDNLAGAHGGLGGVINGNAKVEQAYRDMVEQVTADIKAQNDAITAGTPVYSAWGSILDDTTNANMRQHGVLAQLMTDYYNQHGSLTQLNMQLVQNKVANGDLAGAITYLRGQLGPTTSSVKELTAATEEEAAAAKAMHEANLRLAGGMLGLVQGIADVNAKQKELAKLRAEGKQGTQEYRAAQLALLQAQLSVNDGLRSYMQDLVTSGKTQDQAKDKVYALGKQVGLTKAEVDKILGPLAQYKSRLDDINRTPDPKKTVTTNFVDIYTSKGHRTPATGGPIHKGFAVGGFAGGLGSDRIPAWLSDGEFVMRATAVRALGVPLLRMLNNARPGRPIGAARPPSNQGANRPGYLDIAHMFRQTAKTLKDYQPDLVKHIKAELEAAQKRADAQGLSKAEAKVRNREVEQIQKRLENAQHLAGSWRAAMMRELYKPGESARQRQLVQDYYQAALKTTTKKEARDARARMLRTIRTYEYGAHPFTSTGPGLSFVIRPDRRRFNRDLDYDHLTRGQ